MIIGWDESWTKWIQDLNNFFKWVWDEFEDTGYKRVQVWE